MLWFFCGAAAFLGGAWALYWRWRRRVAREITEGADIEWERLQRNEPDFLTGISRETFDAIYTRVHTPRFPGYALAAVTAFVAALPATFALLVGALHAAHALGAVPEPVEVADRLLLQDGQLRFFSETPPEAALYYIEDLGGFYYFFGVIVVWLVIFAFFMQRFHARRPGYLRDEIIRAR